MLWSPESGIIEAEFDVPSQNESSNFPKSVPHRHASSPYGARQMIYAKQFGNASGKGIFLSQTGRHFGSKTPEESGIYTNSIHKTDQVGTSWSIVSTGYSCAQVCTLRLRQALDTRYLLLCCDAERQGTNQAFSKPLPTYKTIQLTANMEAKHRDLSEYDREVKLSPYPHHFCMENLVIQENRLIFLSFVWISVPPGWRRLV
jgi:hypothetical protein